MDSQKSTPAEPALISDSTTPNPPTGSPGGPAGFAGLPGDPVAPTKFLSKDDPFFPVVVEHLQARRQELKVLPLELDNSSKCLTETASNLLDKWDKEKASNVGACINVFPSGEITGGFYKTGRKAPPERKGRTISQEFTRKARKTIRRAVESGIAEFKVFVTVTFDPKIAQLDDAGRVDQAWAKKEFKRFLNTIKKYYDRRGGNNG
jgi:hypothetical protein